MGERVTTYSGSVTSAAWVIFVGLILQTCYHSIGEIGDPQRTDIQAVTEAIEHLDATTARFADATAQSCECPEETP